jgi:hypothetical protein
MVVVSSSAPSDLISACSSGSASDCRVGNNDDSGECCEISCALKSRNKTSLWMGEVLSS